MQRASRLVQRAALACVLCALSLAATAPPVRAQTPQQPQSTQTPQPRQAKLEELLKGALDHLKKKEFDEAIQLCSEAVAIEPRFSHAILLRAAAYLTEAIRLDPGLTAVYETRAAAYRKLGKIKEAEEDERRAGEKGVKP